jgi:hypothetical protein
MFLVEYRKGQFINIRALYWVSVEKGVKFHITGEPDVLYTVAPEYEKTFLNHLQGFNESISNVEVRYNQIKEERVL